MEQDYLKKIAQEMLTPQTKSQNPMAISNTSKSPDPASLDSATQAGNASGRDWQEEAYQKIKFMKEMYEIQLNKMHVIIAAYLQQHEPLSQQTKNEQLERLMSIKNKLEYLVQFLRMSKNDVQLAHMEELGSLEKQIIRYINTCRPCKPQPHLKQSQPQAQISQMQPHESQMNPWMQSMNVPISTTTMLRNDMSGLQHNSFTSTRSVSNGRKSMINARQHTSNPDERQGNALDSVQQVVMNSLHQNNPISVLQPVNISPLTSKSGMNTLQSNLNSLQTMLQNQQLKQLEQQMSETQYLKPQFQQKHSHRQQPAQLPGDHMTPLHQMTDYSDMKVTQQRAVKFGVFPQDRSTGQRSEYHYQELESGSRFSISSPHILQAASPQVRQHPSPQIDQQNLLSSMAKTGTPLQSANSHFIVPSSSTTLAPSPMPGESEKVNSIIPSLSNTGNIGQLHTIAVSGPADSLAIGTPGKSASPSLVESTILDAADGTASSVISSKSNTEEQAFERLIKAVNSVSHEALTASVRDISSIVSMVDRIAGSAPGSGSRCAVGEDLVARTKSCLHARNFVTQDGPTATKKMRRSIFARPSNIVSSAGSISGSEFLNGFDTSTMEPTATSGIKRPRIEATEEAIPRR